MGIFNEHSSSSSFTTVPLQGAAGPQGIGFKLTPNGNYDIQNKKLVNVKQGADPNDVVTKSQIQLLDNAPGDVRANKAVIYSNSGSVHTNSIYLQDTPDGAGSSNDVRLLTEHQSYENIHLNIPDLKNFDGHGGRAKSEIMVTSTEQHITGRKTFFDISVLKPDNNDQAANKKYVDDEIKKIPSPDLSTYLKKDGTVEMTGNLDMGNQQITNLGANIQNTYDVVNLGFCDTKYLQKVSNSDLDMDNHKIKDMAQPTDDNDAVNKHYVDHNFLNRLTPNALGGELDMRGHKIIVLGNPSNPNDASTKAYVDTEIAKIPSVGSDLSVYLKKDGSVAMTGNLDMNNKQIKDMAQPTDDNDATTKKYFDDKLEQSHLVSSHKTNEFKYLTDTDESSSEYNIIVYGIAAFNQSPHQNKKAYDITLIKDSGSNDYRSRIGFNIYTLAIGTYTIVFEFYPPEMTNIQLSCTASEAYIHKAVQRDFTAYSKLLVQFNNNSKQTPNYIYLTMHGTATATPVQCHLVVYGVKDWSDSVYPGVYDGLDNVMFEYKNGDMEMKVNMDMNNKIISGLINPIFDSEAMNLGYFTNLFKTKYTGTIASGVFQRTNPTNNFQIAADGNNFFNLYSIVFQSNQQVANAQILINGKKQGETTNTDTYHRIGNIISGSNTFDLPKSRKFISIDSMSILDNIGAGTAVNGTFELKVLYSDFFERYHANFNKIVNVNNNRIINVGDALLDQDAINRRVLVNSECHYTIEGEIKFGFFKNFVGTNMIVYKQIRLKRIVISTTSTVTNAAVSIVTRQGGAHHTFSMSIKSGINSMTTNAKLHSIEMAVIIDKNDGRRVVSNFQGKYQFELSTLYI